MRYKLHFAAPLEGGTFTAPICLTRRREPHEPLLTTSWHEVTCERCLGKQPHAAPDPPVALREAFQRYHRLQEPAWAARLRAVRAAFWRVFGRPA